MDSDQTTTQIITHGQPKLKVSHPSQQMWSLRDQCKSHHFVLAFQCFFYMCVSFPCQWSPVIHVFGPYSMGPLNVKSYAKVN